MKSQLHNMGGNFKKCCNSIGMCSNDIKNYLSEIIVNHVKIPLANSVERMGQ